MLINTFLRTLSGLAVAVAAASVVASPAAAQGGVELTPWAGVYIPTSNSIGALDQDISRDVSVAGGARLSFWGTGNLGFEVTGGYAPAKIGDETINETGNTDLLLANARLMLALSPVTNKVGFFIAGGPALLARGSNPFDNNRSSTDLGGTLGLGFRFGGGENSRVGFRIDLEDYLYNGDFGGGNDFQNDLVASLGVSIALGGRASSD
ncbi:MAG: outer membrane beta-barrel protein [Gemmatimonadota bacterium]|nr:outer membrane beta-barrel protein [Gemmatimonadota bacterium]